MKDRIIPAAVLISLILMVGSSVGGYYYGNHKGFASGYSIGHDVGYKSAPKPNSYKEGQYDVLNNLLALETNAYGGLVTNYNGLVNDYNNLRSNVIKYIGATSYQARTPITCTTHSYSMLDSSSTTCY
jgi:hypothetical protein